MSAEGDEDRFRRLPILFDRANADAPFRGRRTASLLRPRIAAQGVR